ncbi:unnamed protein product [Schistocephalus solidus]|uniref:Reverse transcriptase domain-containing protein n=1 Tax=Schistocephalus solidus TaxID=70667 RepID=A0A183SD18_SCHSO|nr:unnamed protein product [Schistocephalus solidus]
MSCYSRTTVGHLNSRCMQAPTRVSMGTVHDLLFTDDCALNTVKEEEMQRSMDIFAAGCAKTVLMHQTPPRAEYNAQRLNVNGAQLRNVETLLIWTRLPKGSPKPARPSAGCKPRGIATVFT